MRRVEQVGATVVEHGSPTRRRRRHAESEKAHGGFGKNGSGHADGGLHNHGLNDVRQNMAADYPHVARAQRARSFDEFAFAGGENLSAHQACIAHPTSQRKRENKIENARPAKSDKSNGEKNSWKREKGIHQHDINKAVDPAAVVASDRSDDEAKRKRCRDHAASDQHRDPCAEDDARKNVAAQFVGAEPVRMRRSIETRGKIDGGGILRREPRREKSEDYEDDDQHHACCGEWVVACGSGNRAAERDGDGGHGSELILAVPPALRKKLLGTLRLVLMPLVPLLAQILP